MRCLAFALFLAGAALAQERASTVQQADRVLAAADDPAAFAKLAAMTQPDRWSVADELSSRGEHEVAVRFARATKLKDKDKLLAYLASRREDPTRPDTWAVLWPAWWKNFSDPKSVPALVAPYVKQGGFVGSFATTIHAVSLFQTGRAAEAVPLLERALATMEAVGCRNNTAWNYYWLAQAVPAKAEHYYGRVLALEEDVFRPLAAYGLGWALGRRGDFAGSKKWLSEAVRLAREPGFRYAALEALAHAELNLGHEERALALYERVAERRPGISAWMNLGRTLAALERWDKAAALYERCVAAKHERWAEAQGQLASCYNNCDRFEDALAAGRAALGAAKGDAHKSHAHYVIGFALHQLGRFDEAERAYRAALSLSAGREGLQHRVALASLLTDQDRHAEALRLTDEILARVPHSRALARRARLLVFLGREKEAPPVAARAVALAKTATERAEALSAQGRALAANGDRPGALAALVEAERAVRGYPRHAAGVSTDIADVARRTGDVTLGIEHLERAIAYYEEVGARHELVGWYGNLADFHRQRGDTKRAVVCAERGLTHAETLGDPVLLLRALWNVAVVAPSPAHKRRVAQRALALVEQVDTETRTRIWRLCGHYLPPAEALPWLRRAIAAEEARGDKPTVANLLQKMAEHHRELLQPEPEQAALGRSIRLARELKDTRLRIWGEVKLAAALSRYGSVERARELFERSLSAVPRVDDPMWRRNALAELANVMVGLGDHERALTLLDTIQALDDKGAGSPLQIAGAWHTRGLVLSSLERLDEALAAYGKAVEIMRAHGIAAGQTLGNVATIYARRGQNARALECLEQALVDARAKGSDYSLTVALMNISGVHHATGDYPAARAALEAVLEPARRVGDRSHAMALSNLAGIDLSEGKTAAAREKLLAARAVRKDDARIVMLLSYTETSGSEPQRAWLEEAVALGSKTAPVGLADWHVCHQRWEAAAAWLRRARAAPPPSLLSQARLHSVGALVEAGLGDLDAALSEARESIRLLTRATGGLDDERAGGLRARHAYVYEHALQVARRTKRPAAAFGVMESARAAVLLQALGNRDALRAVAVPAALRDAEREARAREKAATERYARALEAGAEDLREKWDAIGKARNEVAEVVARIQRAQRLRADVVFPKTASLLDVQGALGKDEALVLFFEAETQVHAIVLQGTKFYYHRFGKDVLAAAAAYRRAASKPHARGLDLPPHETVPFLARRLKKLLLEPLKLRDGVTRVLISPSGELAYLPFSALVDREVAYVPSATTYTLLRGAAKPRGTKVLALGDPTAGERLPASAAEARAVGDVVLLREDASVARLRDALAEVEGWRAVHLACHGTIHAEKPLLSSLQLSGGDLRCLDVFRLKIPADLVVLSACETGKGKVYRAEGVVGFTRAFMFAGAPRVIVSLWKVDDDATRALMETFYEGWAELPAATALKRAQEHVRSQPKWSHPYYWAAWQLWGLPE